MRSTSALAVRVHRILSKLHPPSPPTSQEGQQLLNVLQSSFRKQLDEAHPPLSKRQDGTNTPDRGIPTAFLNESSVATSKHLNSVLMHPLLGTGQEIGDADSAERTVATFENAVIEGRMTANLAGQLIAQYLQSLGARKVERKRGRLSAQVDEWLRSTSQEMTKQFLTDPRFVPRMIEMMFLEGNEEMVWQWLRKVYQRDVITASIDEIVWLRVEDRFVSSLIKQAIHNHQLEEAAMQFVQASQYRVNAERQGWMYLSWMRLGSAIVHLRGRDQIEAGLFDAAMQYALPWSKSPETSKAMCMLYHPTNPTAKTLSDSLQFNAGAEVFLHNQSKASKASRKAMVISLMDAAQLALKEGSRTRATFLLDFAIDNYPDFLPAKETTEIEPQLQVSANYVFG